MSKLSKKKRKIIAALKNIDEESLLLEREEIINSYNHISVDTPLYEILNLRKAYCSYWHKINEIKQPEVKRKFELYLPEEQRKISTDIINNSSIYRTSACSSTVYNKEYGLWEIPHKGQKPVDVKKLNDKKERYKNFKEDPHNSLEEIRKRRLNNIIYWNSYKNPSIYGWDGFYNWLDWFCGSKRGRGRGKWYHIEATQEMRDLQKMIPQGYGAGYISFQGIDNETLVLIKHSNKRKDYRDEDQWKNIINFIRSHNTNLIIKKILYCKYTSKYYENVKIRDKEWEFIKNTGCTYICDKDASYQYEKNVRLTDSIYKVSGKLFSIN